MKPLLDIEKLIDTPEKRMKLIRIFVRIALIMLVLGYILIILSFIYPDFLH